jgi:hypothetical protein
MHEAEGKYHLSKSEIAAMQRVKDQLASGERSGDISGYKPDEEIIPILSGVRIFLRESRWFGEPAEEVPDPKERIADLVRRLDEKILSNAKNKVSGLFERCEVTTQAADGAYLTIGRNRLNNVSIKVEKLLHTFEDEPIKYPYYSSEEFHLCEDGGFSRTYWERYSPDEGCRQVPVVLFNNFSEEFSDEAAQSLKYFSELVAPFLATER